ncbi:hypothetical protein RD110_13720 [Rhodoferax koreense]|uniref:diguanylate cyclase n=1 Tax=Rhodoferax koreensis TaxID=1842727 RepID=A0A1P8JWJ2_9BURK|nr:hypothetical protein RD110_13720 [Rhodoferax koreense]
MADLIPAGSASHATPAQRRQRNEWLALALGLLLLTAALAFVIWEDRASTGERERNRLQTQARVIEENLVRQLQAVDSVLIGMRTELNAQQAGNQVIDADKEARRLKSLSDAMPGVRALYVVDRHGLVLMAEQKNLIGRDARERLYFTTVRDHPDDALVYVSPPYLSIRGNYVINLSKSVTGTDGRFAGIATAVLDQSYFEILARSVVYAPDMSVSLSHADGQVFLITPSYARAVGTSQNAAGSPFTRHRESGTAAAVYEETAEDNRQPRMLALRSVTPPMLHLDKPLVITVARPLSGIYAAWREQAMVYAFFWCLLLVTAALALFFHQARRRALAAAETAVQAAQRETAQRLELAMQSGNIGLLDWHLPSGRVILNPLGHALLGRAADAPPLAAPEWEALRHPEDAAEVAAVQAALLRCEFQTADLEYRVRHAAGHHIYIHMRAEVVARDAADRPLRLVGIFRDVSARKQTEAALADALALQRRTGELARVGGWELDLPDGVPVWTDEVYRIYDMDAHDDGHRPLSLTQALDGYAAKDRARLESALQHAIEDGQPWDMELPMTTVLGRRIWVRSRCEVVRHDGRPRRLVGTIQDTTERMTVQLELERANARLAELSLTDGLTGVANRRRFDQAIAGEWPRSVRQQLPVALLMIDIDHFKAFNDALGHQSGDACLRDVAHILARCAWRPGELLARYGGEEFCILLPGSTTQDALVVAQRCLDRLEQARIPHPASPRSPSSPEAAWLTISIGLASMVPRLGSLPDALVERADTALYQAKRKGRARLECASDPGEDDAMATPLDAQPPLD